MRHPVFARAALRSTDPAGARAARRRQRVAVDRLEERHLLAATITGVSVPISPTPVEGAAFTSLVAKFTDSDKNTDATRYTATINWGDGTTSVGAVTADSKAGFDVSGTHTYSEEGNFRATVHVTDQDGDSADVATSNIVSDAALSASPATVVSGQNVHNAVVAKFTDADPKGKPSDFTATINWGDGLTSAGTLSANGAGGFNVRGSHHYGVSGVYAVQVQIHDGGRGAVLTQFYTPTNLISDGIVPADHTDPNLVNPWGIAGGGGPWWINTNGTGLSELVDGAGNPNAGLPSVTIPPPGGSPAGTTSAPTGIVMPNTKANPNDFIVTSADGKTSGPAAFIFDTEDGTISAWNPNISTNGSKPSNQATLEVDQSAQGSVLKGLALVSMPSGGLLPQGQYLFATDFRNGVVDVFNSKFQPVTPPAGAFQDPTLPTDYAPFGIQAIGGNVYVTYAQQNAAKHDDVAGTGHGFVDVYNTNGFLIQRLGGPGFQPELNSPWAVVKAPANFGQFSNDILVGNFGNSHVSAFDPVSGAFLGQLSDAQGRPLTLTGGFQGSARGLWGMTFGLGGSSGNTNTLYFTSGVNDEADGLFGSITPTSFSTASTTSTVSASSDQKGMGEGHGADDQFDVGDISSGLSATEMSRHANGHTHDGAIEHLMNG